MKRGWPRFTVVIALALWASAASLAQESIDPTQLFEKAVELATNRQYDRAVAMMEQVLPVYPDNPNVLWNLGIWYSELENHSRALETWKHYREVQPDDWHARAKLIQTYQALGQLDLRDQERVDLLKWYAEAGDKERPEREFLCREQFRVGDRKIIAFEYFEPSGERRVFYRFSVLDSEGNEDFWYSLGSYDSTTEFAREIGTVGKDERFYHLDQYDEGFHATFLFFRELPTYESVRQYVVQALKGELKPVSLSTSKE